MNVLDKILEEIEKAEENYKKRCPVLLKGASSMAADVKGIIRSHMDKVENDGWISVEERLPETDDYILISFDNASIVDIGRYEKDEDGGGAFYPGDEDKSYSSIGIFVNAWRPLPEPYKEEKKC